MPACRLTLLVPHLLWPEPEDSQSFSNPATPALETLLTRARLGCDPELTWEDCLAACFANQPGGLARLRRQGEGDEPGEPDGHWLCADPVHLKFHHERVVLADSSRFELQANESAELVAGLNREFGDIGHFEAPHPQRWYLRRDNAVDWPARPLSAAAGRVLVLPEGEPAVKRWLNEIQMYLHAHPVNQTRTAAGKPSVNGLWLWGAETTGKPERKSGSDPGFSGVWSSQPLAIGLARAAHLPQHADATDLDTLLAHAAPDSHHLVLLESLIAPALYEDSESWRDELARLEERWFAPLLARRLPLNLIAPTRYGCLNWTLQPLDTWKFWRRSQPLAALARKLAQ